MWRANQFQETFLKISKELKTVKKNCKCCKMTHHNIPTSLKEKLKSHVENNSSFFYSLYCNVKVYESNYLYQKTVTIRNQSKKNERNKKRITVSIKPLGVIFCLKWVKIVRCHFALIAVCLNVIQIWSQLPMYLREMERLGVTSRGNFHIFKAYDSKLSKIQYPCPYQGWVIWT